MFGLAGRRRGQGEQEEMATARRCACPSNTRFERRMRRAAGASGELVLEILSELLEILLGRLALLASLLLEVVEPLADLLLRGAIARCPRAAHGPAS